MRLSMLLPCALFVACAIPEESFPDAYGSAVCARFRHCDQDSFEDIFDEVEDCVDTTAAGMEVFMDAADLLNQEYDGNEARECINDIRSTACGDFSVDEVVCSVYG